MEKGQDSQVFKLQLLQRDALPGVTCALGAFLQRRMERLAGPSDRLGSGENGRVDLAGLHTHDRLRRRGANSRLNHGTQPKRSAINGQRADNLAP
eukprot:g24779.t1